MSRKIDHSVQINRFLAGILLISVLTINGKIFATSWTEFNFSNVTCRVYFDSIYKFSNIAFVLDSSTISYSLSKITDSSYVYVIQNTKGKTEYSELKTNIIPRFDNSHINVKSITISDIHCQRCDIEIRKEEPITLNISNSTIRYFSVNPETRSLDFYTYPNCSIVINDSYFDQFSLNNIEIESFQTNRSAINDSNYFIPQFKNYFVDLNIANCYIEERITLLDGMYPPRFIKLSNISFGNSESCIDLSGIKYLDDSKNSYHTLAMYVDWYIIKNLNFDYSYTDIYFTEHGDIIDHVRYDTAKNNDRSEIKIRGYDLIMENQVKNHYNNGYKKAYIMTRKTYFMKSFYCLIYTTYIFWGVQLSINKIKFVRFALLLLVIVQYLVGLVCLSYIINMIITK